MVTRRKQGLKKISCWTVVNRDMVSFVSLGVFGEYANNLIASSQCSIYVRMESFCMFSKYV